jgi:hypothetical protein
MFYKTLNEVIDADPSLLDELTPHLRDAIASRTLTFEECVEVIKRLRSSELMRYALSLWSANDLRQHLLH